jgi:hypothetical protein
MLRLSRLRWKLSYWLDMADWRSRWPAGTVTGRRSLRARLADAERRLDAQDEAWTAWREVNGGRLNATAGAVAAVYKGAGLAVPVDVDPELWALNKIIEKCEARKAREDARHLRLVEDRP